ncbi:MAG: hypothetical protein PHY47_13155 [Lachnospiraceae bacterium]|nr:hypothetical protein [Lachnospiraceae bacterium]
MARKKRLIRMLVALVVTTCLVASQSFTAFASNTSSVSQQQLGVLCDGMESIVVQLENLGLSQKDISDLFELSPREDAFYQQTYAHTIVYNGNFAIEQNEHGSKKTADIIQIERMENIYGVALQYFDSIYYEGDKSDEDDFGSYLTYLYMSHYIDGPRRAPTENDFPDIISNRDIRAYKQFMGSTHLSNWANSVSSFGSALYSDFDYPGSLTAINTVNQTISQGVNAVTMEAVDGYNTALALNKVTPLIKNYIVEHHPTATSDTELIDGTLAYVKSQLSVLDFYENYDKNVTDEIVKIIATTFISAIFSSISLMGVFVSAIQPFVYECSGFVQRVALVNLQYSFSGRYVVRMGIYLGS